MCDARPCSAVDNMGDCGGPNSKFPRQGSIRRATNEPGTNGENIVLRNLCAAIFFAKLRLSTKTIPPLVGAVLKVLLEGSNPEVVRVHARWVVASVADVLMGWWRHSIRHYPRCSRGLYRLIGPFMLEVPVPVTAPVFCSGPLPAVGFSRLGGLLPKPRFVAIRK